MQRKGGAGTVFRAGKIQARLAAAPRQPFCATSPAMRMLPALPGPSATAGKAGQLTGEGPEGDEGQEGGQV